MLFFWGIPTLILYMQLSWVGHVPYEDMRYFLPVLPPTAMLTAVALTELKREISPTILGILSFLGFASSYFAINWQLHRGERGGMLWSNPPLWLSILFLLIYTAVYFSLIIPWLDRKLKESSFCK